MAVLRGNKIVGLDVGTTKVAAIISELDADKKINIIGVGTSPAYGLKKGVVVDLESTTKAIAEAVEKSERMAGTTIESAFVGISGEHISSLNSHGVVAVSSPNQEITHEDVERVLQAAGIVPLASDREIIHVIPKDYIIDGQNGIKNPVGMSGMRLEVDTHIVTGGITFIQNLLKCVQRVGIIVDGLVLQPLATSCSILTPDEKEIGVALVDIGGGTTDLAIFYESSIVYTSIIPVGGGHIDRDIAYGLNTTLKEAERLKIEYGYASTTVLPPEENFIKIKDVGDKEIKEIPQRLISEIIEARVFEIFDLIKEEINKSNYQELLPAGIVLTGGTSLLRGIQEVANSYLEIPVRIGNPQYVSGLIEEVRSPIYSTGVGLVLYGASHYEKRRYRTKKIKRINFWQVFLEKIKNLFREF
jgi:cell division protein FtsA